MIEHQPYFYTFRNLALIVLIKRILISKCALAQKIEDLGMVEKSMFVEG